MEYGFKLDWGELPEELREAKIDDYLAYEWENEQPPLDKEEYIENQSNRVCAENMIEARFPMYF